MAWTASKLRENIYSVLDEVLETGIPAEIERKGRRLRIVVDDPPSIFDRLLDRRDAVVGDSEDFVSMDWSHEWSSGADLNS